MKGIVLAGGRATRLHPLTLSTSKHLLSIYDKPMVYYPLSVLMQVGIREIMIISTPHDLPRFRTLFGDGSALGLTFFYAIQEEPRGIADAFLIAESFIDDQSVALILGDNIFYGDHLPALLKQCGRLQFGGVIFGYQVRNPENYGMLVIDGKRRVIDIVEKPDAACSPYAVTGLYFYDRQVVEIAKSLSRSARGELEITDINRVYLFNKNLRVHFFDKGFAWLDAGTFEALHQASVYVHVLQERQGIRVACIEEIAYNNGWIDEKQLLRLAKTLSKSDYGEYLLSLPSSQSSCAGVK